MNTVQLNQANQAQTALVTKSALNASTHNALMHGALTHDALRHGAAYTTARVAGSIVVGGIATFGLFVLMHELIKTDDAVIVTMLPIYAETSIYQEHEEKINKITRMKPPPPLVVQPKVAREDIPASVTPNDTFDDRIFVEIPPTDVKTDIGDTKMQTEARPLVRFNPEYPPVAARDGVEGWVELSFSIDASGAVINVEVLNSDPKRIFDKAAKRALKRWKYQAKIEQGRAIVQHGLSVMLDFKISQ